MMKSSQHSNDILQIFHAGIAAVQPKYLLPKVLNITDGRLQVGEDIFPIDHFKNIYIAGAGKATAAMAAEAEKILGYRITDGVIAIKAGHAVPLKYIRAIEAGHPVPNANSVVAAEEISALLKKAGHGDLVIFLLSGGASSLMTDIAGDWRLHELQTVFRLLLNSGASIDEMNAVRKHLSAMKGGQCVRLCKGATLATFIISDVIGNDLSVIGSGPTVPDPTTFDDALQVILKYRLEQSVPHAILQHLTKGAERIIADTLKEGDPAFTGCRNIIIGDIEQALNAAAIVAQTLGYKTSILTSRMQGPCEEAVKDWLAQVRSYKLGHTHCLLAGGETTVNVTGNGHGGRNQQFALAAAIALQNEPNITLLAAGTDGTDGPTDAAGAIINGSTCHTALQMGLDPCSYLLNNDAYHFFQQTGGLIKTGPTQTNVMDLVITLVN